MWKNIDPEVLSTRPHSSRAEIWSQKGMWFVFFFFFHRVSLRERQDEGWRTISSATCHRVRHLSHALVVDGTEISPFLSHHKESLKTRANLFHLIPFSSAPSCSVSASVSYLRTLLGSRSAAFFRFPHAWKVAFLASHVIYVDSGIDCI